MAGWGLSRLSPGRPFLCAPPTLPQVRAVPGTMMNLVLLRAGRENVPPPGRPFSFRMPFGTQRVASGLSHLFRLP